MHPQMPDTNDRPDGSPSPDGSRSPDGSPASNAAPDPRIQLSAEEMRALGYRVVDMIVDHVAALAEKP
ncbi:MAG: hypothetical protein JO306_15905, partial [Gemmatimonadetes bacterium]|nr:hypothetical protein [Gemmatimonadota bacterium]